MYFNCQTNLVETFRSQFSGEFRFDGNRCIFFGEDDEVPTEPLAFCIATALTYHLTKDFLRS